MPDPDRIIRIRTVLNRTGLSRSTLYRKMADGSFPQRLKLGEHSAAGVSPPSTAGSPTQLTAGSPTQLVGARSTRK